MATFFNRATLSYNGTITDSNIVTGELLEVLSASKDTLSDTYGTNDTITYIITIVNSGQSAFSGLTVTDNLGSYIYNGTPLVPLTYVDGSARYYTNGVLQAAPVVTTGPSLTISGINVPANGNIVLLYEARTNSFATPATDGVITNIATISGSGLSTPIEVTSTISAQETALLSISKSICPETVVENGEITYTFVIQNSGNQPATTDDVVVVTDSFDPILNPISVEFNGTTWTEPTNYTYDTATGLFQTVPGQVTVPAATYTRDETTGQWIVSPGTSVLRITGTV